MAAIDFSSVVVANRTLTGASDTSHTVTPNPKSAAVHYRDDKGGTFKDASGAAVPYSADTWTRIWGRDPSTNLNVVADPITVTPASATAGYARHE